MVILTCIHLELNVFLSTTLVDWSALPVSLKKRKPVNIPWEKKLPHTTNLRKITMYVSTNNKLFRRLQTDQFSRSFFQRRFFFGKTEAQHPVIGFRSIKSRNGNSSHSSFFGQSNGHIFLRFLRNISIRINLEITAITWKGLKSCLRHQALEIISFLLKKTAQLKIVFSLLQELRECNLLWRIAGKGIELMDFSEFFHQNFGRDAISQLPAGAVVNFAKGKTCE